MMLFYKDEIQDLNAVYEAVSEGYGTRHPERIHGFVGNFLFTLQDVYLSDRLEQLIQLLPEFASRLYTLLDRFKKNDFGEVTSNEKDENLEQRYMFGNNTWLIARYDTDAGRIIYESFLNMSLLYLEGEDVTAIREAQENSRFS